MEESKAQASWDLSSSGMEQLRELDKMARSQDNLLGAAFTLYLVVNAILVFSFYQQEEHYLARTGISLVALLANGIWFIQTARTYLCFSIWKGKAQALENDLGVPAQFRVWGDPPTGMTKWRAGQLAIAALLLNWAVCLAFAAVNLASAEL